MEGVSFNEDNLPQISLSVPRASGLAGFLIRSGIAKNEKETTPILIGTLIVALIAMLGVWFMTRDTAELPPLQVELGAPIQQRR